MPRIDLLQWFDSASVEDDIESLDPKEEYVYLRQEKRREKQWIDQCKSVWRKKDREHFNAG